MLKEVTRFPDHEGCETLTKLTLDYLPRDGSLGTVRRYRRGMAVWRPDDRADSIYFLLHGQITVKTSDARGRETNLRVIEPGEPFGELCVCAEKTGLRETAAHARVETELIEIKLQQFIAYLHKNRDAMMSFLFTFCVRLTDTERRLDMLMHRDAQERIARLLLHLASRQRATSTQRVSDIALQISHDELAQMAGMSRPHVSVTMGKLRRRKLVRYQRGRPLVVNVPSLKSYVLAERSE